MATVILDEQFAEKLIAERQEKGLDRYDEVWEGTYMMAPLANNEHQELASRLTSVFIQIADESTRVFAGTNVSDREIDWTKNYRCPDVAVFLHDNVAVDQNSHWYGGPNLAVEIVSKGDRSRDKLDFYSSVSTGELLIVDRDPWQLELYRRRQTVLELVGVAKPDELTITINTLALEARLIPSADADKRPKIQLTHVPTQKTWSI